MDYKFNIRNLSVIAHVDHGALPTLTGKPWVDVMRAVGQLRDCVVATREVLSGSGGVCAAAAGPPWRCCRLPE